MSDTQKKWIPYPISASGSLSTLAKLPLFLNINHITRAQQICDKTSPHYFEDHLARSLLKYTLLHKKSQNAMTRKLQRKIATGFPKTKWGPTAAMHVELYICTTIEL
ncbi:hypothetical protein XPA_008759 [Xanthoria parietina]